MFRTLIGAGLFASVAAAPVAAQDYALAPTYGVLDLSAGFTNDPRTIDLQSGGSIAASSAAGGCRGYIANAPDVRVNYEAGSVYPLIISVNAAADTTLVINAPDAAWHCDDDAGPGLARSFARTQKIAPLRDPRGAIRVGWNYAGQPLGREPLAALGAAPGDDLAAGLGGHARTEAVAAGADQFGRLECTFHGVSPIGISGRSPGGSNSRRG